MRVSSYFGSDRMKDLLKYIHRQSCYTLRQMAKTRPLCDCPIERF